MVILVAYSGGKDSQASLIWAVKKYGVENVKAVFCDTGWENPLTYKHIIDTTKSLNVKLYTIKNKKNDGMISLVRRKKIFPTTKARFCTEELKIHPMIDFILEQKDHVFVIQGIRANESYKRAKMEKHCTYFKYYFEPYNDKGRKLSYRKKDVLSWTKTFQADIIRPVFNWTANEVIKYILENNQEPNPLYKQGFSRVGCFPCIMLGLKEIKQIVERYPERINEIYEIEKELGTSFYPSNKIPDWAKKKSKNNNIKIIEKYIKEQNSTLDMFEDNSISCSSFYGLCE